jgi:hypothetical protein
MVTPMSLEGQVSARSVSRNEVFAALVAIGFANGISERIVVAIKEDGFLPALLDTFDISIIVWAACMVGIIFLLREPIQPVSRSDRLVAVGALAAFLTPIAPLSWLALSMLTAYIVYTSAHSSFPHRGGWVLLAMTVPMFWGRLLFAAFSDLILQGDATLVGWLVGTHRFGNAIQFADGSGYLWIAPACSSLANVSLAILCWVTLIKAAGRPGSWGDIGWILAACCAVIIVNVARISLLGLYRDDFELIHGPLGSAITSLIILAITVAICLAGVHRAPSRA